MDISTFPWGKLDRQEARVAHRLEHHCADVACCFQALLEEPVLKDRFDRAAGEGGLDEVTLGRLAVLAFLHDFGKLSPGFQFSPGIQGGNGRKSPQWVNHIDAAIWACNQRDVLSGLGLDSLAAWGESGLVQLLCAMLAHHGRPISSRKLKRKGWESGWRSFGGYDPIVAGRDLLERARDWFPQAFENGPVLSVKPQLAHLFAGTLTIADQIGSNEKLFPFEPNLDMAYIQRARERAADAVRCFGFGRSRWVTDTPRIDFGTLFEGWSPRPLQKAVAEAPLDSPLLILESETGSGKTEAAIWRFAKLWRAGVVDGLYFALPTRAAAVQLHDRVNRALNRILPKEAGSETVLAVPGYLQAGAETGWRVGSYEVVWRDAPDDEKRFARWSAESARKFLSATVAVGTVDQALLSGLQVKWAHFRGAALARSLLVVDEVHASDAYMTEVLRGVLRGHLEIGGHALLMSATLGAEARNAFASAGAGRRRPRKTKLNDAMAIQYPVLAFSNLQDSLRYAAFDSTGYNKAVSMNQVPVLKEPERIAELAIRKARRGGKVLVVRNTVKGVRAVFDEVCGKGAESLLLQVAGGPTVHHSRFAAEDRRLLDTAVERELGKGRKAGGCIVLGTQTLEQSLDIDADLLITDLCPVDVLLQRMGRLHRHRSSHRPKALRCPECIVLVPEDDLGSEGLLAHGMGMSRNGGIYRDLRILELTRRLISCHTVWRIPEMNRMLVEGGTHPDNREPIEREMKPIWAEKLIGGDGRTAAERMIAGNHALDRSEKFCNLDFPRQDEHVRTRLGDDGLMVRLAEAAAGPLGRQVTTFNIPAHMFRGDHGRPTEEEAMTARVEPARGGLTLIVGAHWFRYDRTGIRKI